MNKGTIQVPFSLVQFIHQHKRKKTMAILLETVTEDQIKNGINARGVLYYYVGTVVEICHDDEWNEFEVEMHKFINDEQEEFERRYY